MSIAIRSFAKINLGLKIGAARPDGFHELRTIYQTIALHDVVRVEVQKGEGIEIRCDDSRVPTDVTNTCYKVAERVMRTVKASGRVVITIEKQLPVQGGMGAASSNAIATMIGSGARAEDDHSSAREASHRRRSRQRPAAVPHRRDRARSRSRTGSLCPARPSADAPGGGHAAGGSLHAQGLRAMGRANRVGSDGRGNERSGLRPG